MKIAFDGRVLSHGAFSGVENYADNLYRAFGKEVELLKPLSTKRYQQQLWEHTLLPVEAAKADLLFCPANIAPFWLLRKTKLVLTLHDVAFKTFPESFSTPFFYYYNYLIPRNIRRADQIITISETSKNEILRFYPEAKEKITVIPLGLHKRYRVLPEVTKQKYLLYVGSINERKNVTGVIEAFELLPEAFGYSLMIVGNFFRNFSINDKTEHIFQRAKANKKIVFKANVSDEELVKIYNQASLFIFPSFYEGFGLPPLEAMACGTPVITSRLSSMPEVCSDAAGYVDPYDIVDIAKKIQTVLENDKLQQDMRSKGLEHIKQFSWEQAADMHMKVFEKALSR